LSDLKESLIAEARAAGFTSVGICRPDAIPQAAERLAAFIGKGYHGQMAWLGERMHWRGDPKALWPEARSVVMLAEAYTPDEDPLANLDKPELATISVYARNRDYHDLVKKRLKRVGRWLLDAAGREARVASPGSRTPAVPPEIKVFVDTAPVMEKPLAAAAGLGWQGKHTNLLGRDIGNWVFLGAIFTTVDLPPDDAETDHCGSCRACLDICPTDAFPAPYQLDARRCISYLTIEHKGPVDTVLRPMMGNRIYGCDDCLAVCPWNKFAVAASETRYAARDDLKAPELAELAMLDDAGFRTRFSGSPIKRIGRERFVRNVLYAIGNSGSKRLAGVAAKLVDDPDAAVSDAAGWALERLR
jgi:epoxyqueuosine reductase